MYRIVTCSCVVTVLAHFVLILAGPVLDGREASESIEAPATTPAPAPPEEERDNGTAAETAGASRVGYGIPHDPHPSLTSIMKTPVEKTSNLAKQTDTRRTTGHKLNGHFTGHGVMIDDRHILADVNSYWPAKVNSNPNFGIITGQAPKRQINIRKPSEEHYSDLRTDMKPKGAPLGGTSLQVFETTLGAQRKTNDPALWKPPILETNPHEYGKDCFVHGWGKPETNKRGKRDSDKEFYNVSDDLRHHVRIPVRGVNSAHCTQMDGKLCDLFVHDEYNFCKASGAGAPVFCGQEQKLTYMSRHSDAERCNEKFQAYHIPRLHGEIEKRKQEMLP